MIPAKAALVAFALVAGLVCVQAAGGIKGRQQASAEGQFRFQSLKGPVSAAPRPTFQQQQYTVQQQAPAPQFTQQQVAAPQFTQQQVAVPQFTQQQVAAPQFTQQSSFTAQSAKTAAAPAAGVQLAPVFNAVRVQAAPAPAPLAVQQVQVQEQEPEQQQQQAPDQEIDPSAAAQEGNAALLALGRAPAAASAASEEEANPRPEPYNFQYAFNSGDQTTSGSSTREEQQDASGRVTGFYTLKGEDGRDRRVDYVADASGFRATISTNELGTANKDSADVDWTAQEPSELQVRAAESATQAARQRALLSPAQNQQQLNTQQHSSSQQHHSSLQQHSQSQQQQAPLSFSSASSSSNQQQQQAPLAFSSSSTSSSLQKFSSPRQRVAAAAATGSTLSRSSSSSNNNNQVQFTAQQLQEPFEQIRQTELNGRARKSRHAPFYLFTV